MSQPARPYKRSEADAGTRTPDPLLTMEVLYQLSYVGATSIVPPMLAAVTDAGVPLPHRHA